MKNRVIFQNLERNEGKNVDWDFVENGTGLLDELNAELGQTHPLYRKAKQAIARRYSQDDVLYELNDNKYAIVHLTYSHHNQEGWPRFILFNTLEEAESFIKYN